MTLRRTLGVWRVSLAGIGVILGAGVYALVGPAAAHAGSAMWLAFAVAGVTAGLTAYSYARFARMQTKDSPEFQYTSMAFGPTTGFVAGWLMLAADLLAAATVALGFGGYFAHLAGTPLVANAVALLVLTAVVLFAGIGASVGLAIALTLVEAAGLVFVIAVGVPSWGRVDLFEMPHGMTGIGTAAALIFFAYLGFDELGNFAEEMRRPERDLPRALAVAMIVTTAIYVLVAVSASSAVPWADLAASRAPLALVARAALGPRAEVALAVIALGATANTVLLLLLSASRSVYGMASAGMLPSRLGRVREGRRVPAGATVAVIAATAALTLLGDVARVAALTDGAVLASFGMVNLALVWLAARGRTARRRADVAVPAIAAALCAWLMAYTGWPGVLTAGVLAAAGVAMALRARRVSGA